MFLIITFILSLDERGNIWTKKDGGTFSLARQGKGEEQKVELRSSIIRRNHKEKGKIGWAIFERASRVENEKPFSSGEDQGVREQVQTAIVGKRINKIEGRKDVDRK